MRMVGIAVMCVAAALAAVCLGGCAKDRVLPDGTVEHEYLDPAVEALINRVIDEAVDVYLAKTPAETPQNDRGEEIEALLVLLPPEAREDARRALEAAKAGDWASLVEALDKLEQVKCQKQ